MTQARIPARLMASLALSLPAAQAAAPLALAAAPDGPAPIFPLLPAALPPRRAWGGSQARQRDALGIVKAHIARGTLVQGQYWSAQAASGCPLGVLTHVTGAAPSLAAASSRLGVPTTYLAAADLIYEALPPAKAAAFAVDWLSALAPGADVRAVTAYWAALVAWLAARPHGARVRALASDAALVCVDAAERGGTLDPTEDEAYMLAHGYALRDLTPAQAKLLTFPLRLLRPFSLAPTHLPCDASQAAYAFLALTRAAPETTC